MSRPAFDRRILVVGAFLFISLTAIEQAKAADLRAEERGVLSDVEKSDLEVKQSQLTLLGVDTKGVNRVLRAERRLSSRIRQAEVRNEIRPKAREIAIEKIKAHHQLILKKILGEKTYAAYDQALKERAQEYKIVSDSHDHRARTRYEGAPPETMELGRRTPAAYQASSEGSDGW